MHMIAISSYAVVQSFREVQYFVTTTYSKATPPRFNKIKQKKLQSVTSIMTTSGDKVICPPTSIIEFQQYTHTI